MGGSAKKVVGVAIAIAVPFVAPKIVGAIAASSMVSGTAIGAALGTTAGATAGSALVGAGLGAAGAAITGGDVRQGALMGGIGGGIGGYTTAAQAAQASQAAQATQAGAGGFNLGDVMAGGTGTGAAAPALYTPVPAAQPAFSLGNVMAGGTGFEAAPQLFSSAPAAAAPAGGSFMEALKGVPGEIAGRFTSSEALADMTLRAGASLLTGQLAGDGLSEEEQQLLQAQMADLQALREQDEELFKTKLQEAMGLLGEARYFDPAQFGMQAQTAVKVAGAQQQREVERQAALRSGRGGMSAADQRRAGLDVAARGQTAFAQGAESAQRQKLATYQAGLAALPTGGPTAGLQYSKGLMDMYGAADKRKKELEGDITDWFGGITGTRTASSIG
jgi:hypothetical protein